MGTRYSATSVSGYNSAPPADDGSTSASNQGFWATIKTKLADPFNTFASAIDGKLTTALDKSARLISASDVSLASDHDRTIQIGSTVSTAITVTLGDAVSMAAGYMVTVSNQSAINQSVTTATSSNTINGTASNTLTLGPRASLSFLINSAATGYNTIGQSNNTITLAATQASTSGTAINFLSIPVGTKRITINFAGVSTSGTDNILFQIGPSGGIESSGYLGSGSAVVNAAGTATTQFTSGYGLTSAGAANILHGSLVLTLVDASTNTWAGNGGFALSNAAVNYQTVGSKSAAGVVDRVRITTTGGTDTFDAGKINIIMEG